MGLDSPAIDFQPPYFPPPYYPHLPGPFIPLHHPSQPHSHHSSLQHGEPSSNHSVRDSFGTSGFVGLNAPSPGMTTLGSFFTGAMGYHHGQPHASTVVPLPPPPPPPSVSQDASSAYATPFGTNTSRLCSSAAMTSPHFVSNMNCYGYGSAPIGTSHGSDPELEATQAAHAFSQLSGGFIQLPHSGGSGDRTTDQVSFSLKAEAIRDQKEKRLRCIIIGVQRCFFNANNLLFLLI